jgi:hypothetical protein
MGVIADFDVKRLANQPCEWGHVPRGGPQLELGVAGRSHLQQHVLSSIVKLESRDDLGVAAIEALGQT